MGAPLDIALLERDGFTIHRVLLAGAELAPLALECDRLLNAAEGPRRRAGVRGAVRLSLPFAQLASSDRVMSLARAILGDAAFLVRSILFDKSPQANWDVPWHRDTTIAVAQRVEVSGFGPWSLKEGTPHVQPPIGVLAAMATLRIHIDPCPASNGALMVVPGSHRPETLSPDGIDPSWCEERSRACELDAGGCLIMRPLILHASRKSEVDSRRRVLHLEFAAQRLPGGLEWGRH